MTETTTARSGQPCWIELYASVPEQSAEFYRELFGWNIEEMDSDCPLSHVITQGEQMVGTIEPLADGPVPAAGWLVCLWTPDLTALVARVVPAGGEVVAEPIQVDESTRYAVVRDPDGGLVGVLEDPNFVPAVPGAGTPVWFDALTRDLERGARFYREVFEWDTHPMSDAPYVTHGVGEDSVCGIGDLGYFGAPGAEPGWQVYFGVADFEEAAQHVARLGGEVVVEPRDTPWGRMATVKDPQGAVFLLIQVGSAPQG